MASPRFFDTATLLPDGRVLIAGGATSAAETPLASVELYDPATGTFTATGSMHFAREGHTATLLANGRVLIAGGSWATSTAELYDPATGKFTATGSMTTLYRRYFTATLLDDGRVLIVGGQGIADNSAEIYDPNTGKFTATGSMSTARHGHTATLLADGRVLVAGGRTRDGRTGIASAEVYDPTTGKFTATGSMSVRRMWHAAVRLHDGRVLVVGGRSELAQNLAIAELYDPSTGAFIDVDKREAISGSTATLLPDGRVLIAGGLGPANSPEAALTAELFDPGTEAFTATGPLMIARYANTATLLKDGRVLIAGGEPSLGASTALASAELIQP